MPGNTTHGSYGLGLSGTVVVSPPSLIGLKTDYTYLCYVIVRCFNMTTASNGCYLRLEVSGILDAFIITREFVGQCIESSAPDFRPPHHSA